MQTESTCWTAPISTALFVWQGWAISAQRVSWHLACRLDTGGDREGHEIFSYLIFHALAQSGWAIFGKDACSFIVCTCVQFLKNYRGSGSSYGSWRKGGGLLSCFLPGMISAVWVYWCGKVWPVQQHGFWLCLRVLNRRSPNPSCSQSLMSPAYSFHKP